MFLTCYSAVKWQQRQWSRVGFGRVAYTTGIQCNLVLTTQSPSLMPMCLSTNWENNLRPEAWQQRVGDDGPVFTEVNRKSGSVKPTTNSLVRRHITSLFPLLKRPMNVLPWHLCSILILSFVVFVVFVITVITLCPALISSLLHEVLHWCPCTCWSTGRTIHALYLNINSGSYCRVFPKHSSLTRQIATHPTERLPLVYNSIT